MTIVLTILASILVFGVIILIHELGHFISAKKSGIKVLDFSFGMGPKLFGFKKGDTAYNVRLFPIGGSVTMEGEDEESEESGSFSKAPVWKRMITIAAGAIMNLLLGFAILVGITIHDGMVLTRTLAGVETESIVYKTGLRDGDTILSINGRKLYIANDIVYELVRLKSPLSDVVVRRDGEKVELKDVQFDITPDPETGYNELELHFSVYAEKCTVGSVLREAGMQTMALSRLVFLSLVDLITGRVPLNQMSGPVGIVTVINEAVKIDFSQVLWIMAFISINLGIFNLLPVPALDGGRLVFLLIEAIFGKRVNPKFEAVLHFAFLMALFAFMIFVTFNDVTKLFK